MECYFYCIFVPVVISCVTDWVQEHLEERNKGEGEVGKGDEEEGGGGVGGKELCCS